jgi:hypothetical protein
MKWLFWIMFMMMAAPIPLHAEPQFDKCHSSQMTDEIFFHRVDKANTGFRSNFPEGGGLASSEEKMGMDLGWSEFTYSHEDKLNKRVLSGVQVYSHVMMKNGVWRPRWALSYILTKLTNCHVWGNDGDDRAIFLENLKEVENYLYGPKSIDHNIKKCIEFYGIKVGFWRTYPKDKKGGTTVAYYMRDGVNVSNSCFMVIPAK